MGEGLFLFAPYSEGFRAPPFSGLNIGLGLPTLDDKIRPNPGARPERSRGLDLGLCLAGPAASGTLTVQRGDFRDLIESRADLGVDPATGARILPSVNRERARINGSRPSSRSSSRR